VYQLVLGNKFYKEDPLLSKIIILLPLGSIISTVNNSRPTHEIPACENLVKILVKFQIIILKGD
jgi:hypothetical protein